MLLDALERSIKMRERSDCVAGRGFLCNVEGFEFIVVLFMNI